MVIEPQKIGVWFLLVLPGSTAAVIARRNAGVDTGFFKGQERLRLIHVWCMSIAFFLALVAVMLALLTKQIPVAYHAYTGMLTILLFLTQLLLGYNGGSTGLTVHRYIGQFMVVLSFAWQIPAGTNLVLGINAAALLWIIGPVIIITTWLLVRAVYTRGVSYSRVEGSDDYRWKKLIDERFVEVGNSGGGKGRIPPSIPSLSSELQRRDSSMIEAQPRGASITREAGDPKRSPR